MKIEFRHERDLGGRHRIVAVESDMTGARMEVTGHWTAYQCPAHLHYLGQHLTAFTEYFEGEYQPGRVYEVLTPRHSFRFNKTEQDAHERVLDMSMGCLADATDEFLLAFETKLHLLVDRVRRERVVRIERHNEREEG